MNIPELSRPGTKNSAMTGGATTTLNKSSHGAANFVSDDSMRNSIPAPFVSPGPFKGTTPKNTPALIDGKSDLLGKLDIESVDSEMDYPADDVAIVTGRSAENGHDALLGNSANGKSEEEKAVNQQENSSIETAVEEIVTKGIRLSLTTDGGLEGGLEIYDYDKRGRYSFNFALYSLSIVQQ